MTGPYSLGMSGVVVMTFDRESTGEGFLTYSYSSYVGRVRLPRFLWHLPGNLQYLQVTVDFVYLKRA